MKNDLKTALDTALAGMDWQREDAVLRAVRAQQRPVPQVRRISTRALVLAALMILLLLATALAIGLNYSAGYQAQRQAIHAMEEQYGLTDDMMDFFSLSQERTPDGWMVILEPIVYAREIGTYTAECGRDGLVTAHWSQEGTEDEQAASGTLSAPVWGAAQLARLLEVYRQRSENWRNNAKDRGELTLEERAALDTPLLAEAGLREIVDIAPEEGDLTPEAAEQIARQTVRDRYGLAEDCLLNYRAGLSFLLYTETATRVYRVDLVGENTEDAFAVRVESPSGNVISCRWLTEHFVLPEGDLALYPEAAEEFIQSGAFDALTVVEKADVAQRYESAGLAGLLEVRYAPLQSAILSEKEALELAIRAMEETYGLTGAWQSFFDRSISLLRRDDRSVWRLTWQGCEQPDWHWQAFDRLGTYTVELDGNTGERIDVSWSLAGTKTLAYTASSWGGAEAYSAEMLPWIARLLEQAQEILNRYPADTNLNEMSLADQAAYDALFREVGYPWQQYPAVLPQEKDISQESAASLALEAIQEIYGAHPEQLSRGEPFQEGFRLWKEDENIIRTWFISYVQEADLYTVQVHAETGEILSIWHDNPALGNG